MVKMVGVLYGSVWYCTCVLYKKGYFSRVGIFVWRCIGWSVCVYKVIVGVFEGFRMERREALRAGHYLISLLALKFVLLCLKLLNMEKAEFPCQK